MVTFDSFDFCKFDGLFSSYFTFDFYNYEGLFSI